MKLIDADHCRTRLLDADEVHAAQMLADEPSVRCRDCTYQLREETMDSRFCRLGDAPVLEPFDDFGCVYFKKRGS